MATQTMKSTVADSKLQEFFIDQLKDIYWAEKKLRKALLKLANAATSDQLKNAFLNHQQQTQEHINRLKEVFNMIGQEAESTKCHAMAGIVDEASDIIDETDDHSAQRDVGLIFAAQKAEHYEIATYGGLVQLARTMDQENCAELLNQTLTEEKVFDGLLTKIAEVYYNVKATTERFES